MGGKGREELGQEEREVNKGREGERNGDMRKGEQGREGERNGDRKREEGGWKRYCTCTCK